jgi:hypothetical protein
MTNTFTKKKLACNGVTGTVWAALPFQLVSLTEMLEHHANLFYFTTHKLTRLQTRIAKAIEERGGDSLPTQVEADHTRKFIKRMEREAERLQFFRVMEKLDDFNDDEALLQPFVGRPFTLSRLQFQLEELNKEIARALGQCRFMMIPASKAGYYNQPELFGAEVATKFPKANKEIREAGNCYATGSNTACVFHLMRAVELGARILVSRLKVAKNLKRPVELCDWGAIETALNDAVKKLPKRTSVKASETSAFYSHAVAQFFNFKDAWRNQVSHTRITYDEHQAMSVIVNTRQFMEHLAARLKE